MRATRAVLPAATALTALAAWAFVEPHLPVLRHAQVPVLPPEGTPVRVLHVSDLHLLPRSRRRAAWVRDLALLRPALVVSTGDHWSSAQAADLLVETLGALTVDGALGVFVPGNNDYYSPILPSPLGYLQGSRRAPHRRPPDLPWDELAAALVAQGWVDLTHARQVHQVGGTPLVLAGTDDAHLLRDRYRGEVAGAVPPGVVGVGVVHTPARRLLRAFARDGYALVLAGHTHGGQLRVPFAGPVVTNCDLPRWRARGLTAEQGSWLHVSAGLGTSPYLPVRTACRPEATLLELVPRPTAGPVR
jgi:predicted MPP superfamily phosphohydrolase